MRDALRKGGLPVLALCCLLGIGAVTFLVECGVALRLQAEQHYGEGIVLWQAQNVTDWKKAFHPVEVYPHLVFHYPPLFHLTSRAVAVITGDLLVAGRLVSIGSMFLICGIFAFIARSCMKAKGASPPIQWLAAFLAATLLFTLAVSRSALLMRVDLLALLFVFTGLTAFLFSGSKPWLLWFAFGCFVVALFTKQTMIAAPLICFLLATLERPKLVTKVAAACVAVGLAVLYLLQTVTDGYYLRHNIFYNVNPFSIHRFIRLSSEHITTVAAILGLALSVPFVYLLGARKPGAGLVALLRAFLKGDLFERATTILSAYMLAAAGTTLAMGKIGSGSNYYLEMDLSATLLVALLCGWTAYQAFDRDEQSYKLLGCALVCVLLIHSVPIVELTRVAAASVFRPLPNYTGAVVEAVKKIEGPVYSEDLMVLLLASKDLPAEPYIITALADTKQWDESSFVQRFERREFAGFVVMHLQDRDRFTRALADAVTRNYVVNQQIGPYKIMTPKRD